MADRIVDERERNKAQAADACPVGRGADRVPLLPAAQDSCIVADRTPVFAVPDYQKRARSSNQGRGNC
jgi:hypothetical protein